MPKKDKETQNWLNEGYKNMENEFKKDKDKKTKKSNLTVSAELKQKLKIFCAERNIKMCDFVEKALQTLMENRKE